MCVNLILALQKFSEFAFQNKFRKRKFECGYSLLFLFPLFYKHKTVLMKKIFVVPVLLFVNSVERCLNLKCNNIYGK